MSNLFKYEVTPWIRDDIAFIKGNVFYGQYLQVRHNHIFHSCLSMDVNNPSMDPIIQKIKPKHRVHIFLTWRTFTFEEDLVNAIRYFYTLSKNTVVIHYPKETSAHGVDLLKGAIPRVKQDALKEVTGWFEMVIDSGDIRFKSSDDTGLTLRYDPNEDVYRATDIKDINRLISRNKAYAIKTIWDFMMMDKEMKKQYDHKFSIKDAKIIKPDLAGRMAEIQNELTEGIPSKEVKEDLADVMINTKRQLTDAK